MTNENKPSGPLTWYLRTMAGICVGATAIGVGAMAARAQNYLNPTVHQAVALDSPDANCAKPNAEQDMAALREAAVRCTRLKRAGRVAMVGFGVPMNRLSYIADLTEDALRVSSAGQVAINIDPFLFKPTGAQGYWSKVSPDCTGKGISPAQLADASMTDLARYPSVIAVTAAGCENGPSGTSRGKRYSEVFGLPEKPDYESIATDAAHELYHSLFGLGHRGEVFSHTSWNVETFLNVRDKVFDLGAYLAQCFVRQYSAPSLNDIMGYGTQHSLAITYAGDGGVASARLSPPHREHMQWADVFLGDQPSLQRNITEQWTTISLDEAHMGVYASIRLDSPISKMVETSGRKSEERIFSHIAVMPPLVALEGNNIPALYIGRYAQFFLVGDNGATVVSTEVFPIKLRESNAQYGEPTMTFVIGKQRLDFSLDESRFGVRAASAQ